MIVAITATEKPTSSELEAHNAVHFCTNPCKISTQAAKKPGLARYANGLLLLLCLGLSGLSRSFRVTKASPEGKGASRWARSSARALRALLLLRSLICHPTLPWSYTYIQTSQPLWEGR